MPAQIPAINLLGKNAPDNSVFSRMIDWITTYGRYIMVTTELVVLVAFVSRFTLDRRLTDLNEMISQKQEILEVNQPLETEFRATQARIKVAQSIIAAQGKPYNGLLAVQQIIPGGTYIDSFSVAGEKLNLSMVSVSTTSFAQFLSLLMTQKNISGVSVDNIGSRPLAGITYTLSAIVSGNPVNGAK